MSKFLKCAVSFILIILTIFSPAGLLSSSVTASAAKKKDLNAEEVFLKQKTPITCTLASAAMLMRRTAICASYSDWEDITEENIRETAWIEDLGLLWNFTCFNITIGHGYFQTSNKKAEIIELLKENPQGIVIYNTGNKKQSHAVFLCDYDKKKDIFYVADPSSEAPEGRIPLSKSTIVGKNQTEKLKNISAYWYVVSPEVKVDKKGNYTAKELPADGIDKYNPKKDLAAFKKTKQEIKAHYVVSYDSEAGIALRTYPSGNSDIYKRVKKGTILYITYSGKNDFGATWYKTNTGHYVFSSNLDTFDDYSTEIAKYNKTAKKIKSTYTVKAKNDTKTPLRLEPSEGNNIVAYAKNGTKLYMVRSGENSVGAVWLRTEEGYYVKKSQTKAYSSGKSKKAGYKGTVNKLSGEYSSNPIADESDASTLSKAVKYKVTASLLNVRKSAVDGEVLGTLEKGTIVEVVAVVSGWGKISYEGTDAWISLEYAEKVKTTKEPQSAVSKEEPVSSESKEEQKSKVKFKSAKLSVSKMNVGETLKCTVSVSGKPVPTFKFTVYNEAGKKVFESKKFGKSNEISYTPEKAGVYYFSVDVKFDDGQTVQGCSKNFTVYNILKLNSVNSSVQETSVNEKIKWTVDTDASAEGANYHYSVYHNGELLVEKKSTLPTFKYTPKKTGDYFVEVYLADKYSSSEKVVSEVVTVKESLSIDSVSISAEEIYVNNEILCTVEASGGAGDYQYRFSVYKDDTAVKTGKFSDKNEYSIKLTEAGVYTIYCEVKDAAKKIVSEFSSEFAVSDLLLGDVNGDNKVSAGDARLVLRHSASLEKLTGANLIAADVNHDEKISASDARLILRCAANLEVLG